MVHVWRSQTLWISLTSFRPAQCAHQAKAEVRDGNETNASQLAQREHGVLPQRAALLPAGLASEPGKTDLAACPGHLLPWIHGTFLPNSTVGTSLSWLAGLSMGRTGSSQIHLTNVRC